MRGAERSALTRFAAGITACAGWALPSPQNLLMAPLLNRLRKQQQHALWVRPDPAALAHISALLAQHNIHPHIEKAYPFTEIAKAIRHSKTGKVSGKLVLDFTATP